MPIILLLVAILIVLIGGPIALGITAGAAIALPAWLLWSSGLFQVMFWVLVIGVGLLVVFVITNGMSKATAVFPNSRACVKCGHSQPKDMRFCFKCSHEHVNSA